jgi:glycosyltransferase involved in cell wall biosynthesis
MKVAFNARLLRSPTLRGWNRYTINLLSELALLDVEIFLYSDQPIHIDHLARLPVGSYQIRLSPPMRYPIWEQWWLPNQCQKDQIDILHCPFNFGLPYFSPCPRVLTLHDAIDQVYYGKNAAWQERFKLSNLQMDLHNRIARTKAEAIITVSNHAKTDLIKHLHIPESKITVIYEAADQKFHETVSPEQRSHIREHYQLKQPYFFYLGGWEKRKNIPFLVKSFANANLDNLNLVLGGGNAEQKVELIKLAKELGIEDRLVLLGWIEDNDLPALYAEALCFVYPSEYEGFGLQLCEAIAVGCPVLAARATCLPEILGNGGETFDLDRTEELSQLLVTISSDRKFRKELSDRAFQKSQEYSWRETAISTISTYKFLRGLKPEWNS